jgi:Uncharacterized conserved protein
MICVARIYESPGNADGWRVLVDRFWPRGVRLLFGAKDERPNQAVVLRDVLKGKA